MAKQKGEVTIQIVTSQIVRDAILPISILSLALLTDGPWCPLRHFVGIPCPTCGMTRAYRALFRRDVSEAFSMHPLFWLVPILLSIFLLRRYNHAAKKIIENGFFWGGIITIFVIVWCLRMAFLFPNKAPMDFNNNAVVYKLLNNASSK
ncbi:MAG: DUF2752 domain-containing protein [bacterium]